MGYVWALIYGQADEQACPPPFSIQYVYRAEILGKEDFHCQEEKGSTADFLPICPFSLKPHGKL